MRHAQAVVRRVTGDLAGLAGRAAAEAEKLLVSARRALRRAENDLHDLGVRTVVIPRKGRPGKACQAHEHRRTFRRTVKWRTGSETRISTLKRQYGWDRTRLDRPRRGPDLDRTRGPGPQPGQDRRPGRVIERPPEINPRRSGAEKSPQRRRPSSSGRSR